MKIAIIGAGIGGLTTAIALKQKGFQVEIFESAKVFKPAGSGINLAINAMQVYKSLGVYDEIAEAGNYTQSMNITDERFHILSKINLISFERHYNVKTFAIHRSKLHAILLKHLQEVPIHLSKKLHRIESTKPFDVKFTFEDGTKSNSDILIGADGIHSKVRESIFKQTQKRNAQQVCWRGIVNTTLPQNFQNELNELWGKGKRFGFVTISSTEVYWYALSSYKGELTSEIRNTSLTEAFKDFHPVVRKLITSTSKNNILCNEMIDLKPIKNWCHEGICLMGDASHATTPNLGQGACQAIESAYTLAQSLATEKDISQAFQKYESKRKLNAYHVVNTSWRIGKMAHWENNWAVWLRNLIMKNTPESVMQKSNNKIYAVNL